MDNTLLQTSGDAMPLGDMKAMEGQNLHSDIDDKFLLWEVLRHDGLRQQNPEGAS